MDLKTKITILLAFIIALVLIFTEVFISSCYCPVSFYFTCRTSFSISCRADLVVINSLNFCLSGNVLISPAFLKDGFARYRILGWQLFSFSTLNISGHCLLDSKVSDEKLADNLTEDYMYVTNRFSVAAFKILSLTFNSLIIICLSGHLFEFISFLKIHVFHCFWEIFSHYFFRYSFCPFLFLVPFCDPSQCICWSTGWCPTGLLGSVHFISFFFINLFILFILFLAALGLRCCARAFSSCSERRLLLVAVRGLLIAVASLVADHGL